MTQQLSPTDRLVFLAKSRGLMARRLVLDRIHGLPPLLGRSECPGTTLLAESRSSLYTETDALEADLQLGKVQNLRVAARKLDRLLIPAGAVFSFWRQIGRPSRAAGFVEGRELRQGCLIPTVAGGICQMTNALYHVARTAGLIIVERHGHTARIAGAAFGPGEDATVFWNYVDLRFQAVRPVVLTTRLSETHLIVRLESINV